MFSNLVDKLKACLQTKYILFYSADDDWQADTPINTLHDLKASTTLTAALHFIMRFSVIVLGVLTIATSSAMSIPLRIHEARGYDEVLRRDHNLVVRDVVQAIYARQLAHLDARSLFHLQAKRADDPDAITTAPPPDTKSEAGRAPPPTPPAASSAKAPAGNHPPDEKTPAITNPSAIPVGRGQPVGAHWDDAPATGYKWKPGDKEFATPVGDSSTLRPPPPFKALGYNHEVGGNVPPPPDASEKSSKAGKAKHKIGSLMIGTGAPQVPLETTYHPESPVDREPDRDHPAPAIDSNTVHPARRPRRK
ncbi:hypothetical protein EIP91_009011 [Steccherinum ochraceum]|uniref:Uncharacterized protein n=1 Tax=Steccherinum ochraceum TaxID=92696 RepID=A0A4R0R7R4_9APHY|nr:hypothetical protein EIP91_009011 [Steccherinum ochraceum]